MGFGCGGHNGGWIWIIIIILLLFCFWDNDCVDTTC
ncbi:putative membrane protein [Propionispora sp. 2/2-37]|nr:putative membrane protein [Propionispora sp. 2/2-37]